MKAQLWNLTLRTEGQDEEKNEEEASASASASSATNACNHNASSATCSFLMSSQGGERETSIMQKAWWCLIRAVFGVLTLASPGDATCLLLQPMTALEPAQSVQPGHVSCGSRIMTNASAPSSWCGSASEADAEAHTPHLHYLVAVSSGIIACD